MPLMFVGPQWGYEKIMVVGWGGGASNDLKSFIWKGTPIFLNQSHQISPLAVTRTVDIKQTSCWIITRSGRIAPKEGASLRTRLSGWHIVNNLAFKLFNTQRPAQTSSADTARCCRGSVSAAGESLSWDVHHIVIVCDSLRVLGMCTLEDADLLWASLLAAPFLSHASFLI